jgi:hypothetical protein
MSSPLVTEEEILPFLEKVESSLREKNAKIVE